MAAWWLPMAISAGSKLAGGLFGGGDEDGMTDEQKQWLQYLQQELKGNPGWLMQAFQQMADQAGGRVRAWGAKNLPAGVASGNLAGMEMQERARAMQPYGGALAGYRGGIMSQISGLLGGQQKSQFPWYQLLSGMGSDIAGGLQQYSQQNKEDEFWQQLLEAYKSKE